MDPKSKGVGHTHTTGPGKGRTRSTEKHLGMRPAPGKGEFHKAGRGSGARGCRGSHRPGTSYERWPDRRPFGAGGPSSAHQEACYAILRELGGRSKGTRPWPFCESPVGSEQVPPLPSHPQSLQQFSLFASEPYHSYSTGLHASSPVTGQVASHGFPASTLPTAPGGRYSGCPPSAVAQRARVTCPRSQCLSVSSRWEGKSDHFLRASPGQPPGTPRTRRNSPAGHAPPSRNDRTDQRGTATLSSTRALLDRDEV